MTSRPKSVETRASMLPISAMARSTPVASHQHQADRRDAREPADGEPSAAIRLGADHGQQQCHQATEPGARRDEVEPLDDDREPGVAARCRVAGQHVGEHGQRSGRGDDRQDQWPGWSSTDRDPQRHGGQHERDASTDGLGTERGPRDIGETHTRVRHLRPEHDDRAHDRDTPGTPGERRGSPATIGARPRPPRTSHRAVRTGRRTGSSARARRSVTVTAAGIEAFGDTSPPTVVGTAVSTPNANGAGRQVAVHRRDRAPGDRIDPAVTGSAAGPAVVPRHRRPPWSGLP